MKSGRGGRRTRNVIGCVDLRGGEDKGKKEEKTEVDEKKEVD